MHILSAKNGSSEHPEADLCGMGGASPAQLILTPPRTCRRRRSQHDAWKDFAKKVGESSASLLSCDVGVSEYGDKDNADIAERFSIKTDDFPQYRLWLKARGSGSGHVRPRAEDLGVVGVCIHNNEVDRP